MITQHAWMFLSGYERLRPKILASDIVNMAHLGPRAFEDIAGEVVQTASFVFRWTNIPTYAGLYVRLIDFLSEMAKEEAFLSGSCRLFSAKSKYALLPGSPIAYWVSKNVLSVYNHGVPLGEIAAPRKGNSTSDNNRFLRFWAEVNVNKINLHSSEITVADSIKRRWYPYNKGGGYRKWYGFNEYLVDWYNDAAAIRSIKTAVIANYQYFMKPGLTWSTVSSNNFSIRQFGSGYIFDNGGCCIFDLGDKSDYLLGLLNSEVFRYIFGQLNPTLNFQSGEVAKFPVIYKSSEEVNALVKENVHLSTDEYDSYETSWDFQHHPLLRKVPTIAEAFDQWQAECDNRFNQLKSNEEELNRTFIDIYGLQDELTPEVEDKDVTVRKADLGRDIRSFISYAVGCMFGRYSLDVDGLAYAGGEFSDQWVAVSGQYYKREVVEYYVSAELSRAFGMAEINVSSGRDISLDENAAKRGAIFVIGSDEKSGSVDSFQYRRGTSKKLYEGIRTISFDSKRINSGTGNTIYDLCSPENTYSNLKRKQ